MYSIWRNWKTVFWLPWFAELNVIIQDFFLLRSTKNWLMCTAQIQLIRIELRVPEYGWTTQKVFHLMNFIVNGGEIRCFSYEWNLVIAVLCRCLLFGFWEILCIAVRAVVFGFHNQVFVLRPKVSLLLLSEKDYPCWRITLLSSICLLFIPVFYLLDIFI